MRQKGVKLSRDLPGTVLSVEEALSLIAERIGDDGDEGVSSWIEWIDAENARREDEREAWEIEPVEVKGVTLTLGKWYAITEKVGAWSRHGGTDRTYRFGQYRGRRGFGGEPENVIYLFDKWSQAASKKFARYNSPTPDSYTERKLARIETAEETEALRQAIEYRKVPVGEREAFVRDGLAGTTAD